MSAVADAPTRRSTLRSRVALIRTFAARDLKARFTATRLGLLWALIVPLATVAIYSAVFSIIFRAQAPGMGNGRDAVFAVWFFAGLVPWNMFSQSVGVGLGSILAMGPMLQKVYIPSYVPVAAATLTVIIEKCLEAAVLLAVLLLLLNVGWTWLLFPLVVILLGVFAGSLAYLLAVANVHFRDVGQMMAVVLQMWFFLTPIMYPLNMIPEEWNGIPLRGLMRLNPMTQFVDITRDLLYDLRVPSLSSVLYVFAATAALLVGAWLVHRRWGRDVAEAI